MKLEGKVCEIKQVGGPDADELRNQFDLGNSEGIVVTVWNAPSLPEFGKTLTVTIEEREQR